MKIRQAVKSDVAAIMAIWNPLIRDSVATFTTQEKTSEGMAAIIAERGAAFIVAEVAGVVQGFATFGAFRAGPGYTHTREHSVMFAEHARRKGYGRALMERLESVALRDGIHVLVAGVSGENPDGLAFHEAIGFRKVAHMPEVGLKFGRWMDLILLQKIL